MIPLSCLYGFEIGVYAGQQSKYLIKTFNLIYIFKFYNKFFLFNINYNLIIEHGIICYGETSPLKCNSVTSPGKKLIALHRYSQIKL